VNAQTTITGSSRRDAYVPMVEALLPGCEGEELKLRCGILLMRDYATSRLRWCTAETGELLLVIQRIATQYAFTTIGLAALESLHHELVRLSAVATNLARIFPAAPAGGEDARG
jgi:hypothetical protein